ncbi:MAG: hypothetical protein CL489_00025 [Acidobacteria bacterium]|nr:hypothetical protein [Acidobacteriota bacterium]
MVLLLNHLAQTLGSYLLHRLMLVQGILTITHNIRPLIILGLMGQLLQVNGLEADIVMFSYNLLV